MFQAFHAKLSKKSVCENNLVDKMHVIHFSPPDRWVEVKGLSLNEKHPARFDTNEYSVLM